MKTKIMRKQNKFLVVAAAVTALLFATEASAQEKTPMKLGIGLNVGVPTNEGSNFAIGADLRYQIDVNKRLSVPITAGYTNISNKDSWGGGSFGYIPVKGGVKYFFNESGGGAYGLAEIGAGFGTSSGSGTSFVYSPAIGYAWGSGIDLGVKYEGLSNNGANTGYVGLRLAYGFRL